MKIDCLYNAEVKIPPGLFDQSAKPIVDEIICNDVNDIIVVGEMIT